MTGQTYSIFSCSAVLHLYDGNLVPVEKYIVAEDFGPAQNKFILHFKTDAVEKFEGVRIVRLGEVLV